MKYLILLELLRMSTAYAGEPSPKRGVVLMGDETHQMEVSMDPGRGSADVYVVKNKGDLPASIALAIVDAKGNRHVYNLKAIDSPARRYHGSLGHEAQSFVGVELRIPLGSEPPLVLRPSR
jgi:hypothetical protein